MLYELNDGLILGYKLKSNGFYVSLRNTTDALNKLTDKGETQYLCPNVWMRTLDVPKIPTEAWAEAQGLGQAEVRKTDRPGFLKYEPLDPCRPFWIQLKNPKNIKFLDGLIFAQENCLIISDRALRVLDEVDNVEHPRLPAEIRDADGHVMNEEPYWAVFVKRLLKYDFYLNWPDEIIPSAYQATRDATTVLSSCIKYAPEVIEMLNKVPIFADGSPVINQELLEAFQDTGHKSFAIESPKSSAKKWDQNVSRIYSLVEN